MIRKKLAAIFLFLLIIFIDYTYASQKIKGKVIDYTTEKGISNLVIKLKNYNISTTTKKDGSFKIVVPDNLKEIKFEVGKKFRIKKTIFLSNNEILLMVEEIGKAKIVELSLKELMNLKVYSTSKKLEKIMETPAPVNVITSKDIELLNFNTLEEVLEYITGLASVNGEGNIFTTTTIRGNTLINYNTNTLLLFDGIPLYNPYNGSFDLNSIPLSSIERIEIIKGANSVLYGTNAINAVINIISKRIKKDGNSNVKGRVKYGSFDTFYFQNSIMMKSGKLEFYQFIDTLRSRGESLPFKDEKGQTLELEKSYRGISSISKIVYGDFSGLIKYFSKNLPGVRTREFKKIYTSPEDEEGILKPEISDENSYLININFNKRISKKIEMKIQSDFFRWKLKKQLNDGYWEYSSKGFYNIFELIFRASEKIYNRIGLNYNHYIGRRYKSQLNNYDIGKNNVWTDDFAFYLNGEYNILEQVKLFYGGRYYYARYYKTTLSNFSPKFSLVYTPREKLSFKIIYGKSFRIPTYFEKEVYSEKMLGNPNLLPEKSNSFDFIISKKFKKELQFNIDFFSTKIINKIERVTSPENPEFKINLNIGEVRFWGTELNVRFGIKDKVYGFGGYSHIIGHDKNKDKRLKYTFSNMINAGISIYPTKNLEINSSLKHMGKWGDAEPYTLLNIGLKFFPSLSSKFSFELKGENLLNEKVYLPEIARQSPIVPVIPKTFSRKFYISFSYEF